MANTRQKQKPGRKKELEYNTEIQVGRVNKSYKDPYRYKKQKDKERQMKRIGYNLSEEKIEKIIQVADREKELGFTNFCKCYKGNRLAYVNKFLFDTNLQAKERICYRYAAIAVKAKGKLRNGKEVKIAYIEKKPEEQVTKWKPYQLTYDEKKIGRYKSQREVIEKIKDLIDYVE